MKFKHADIPAALALVREQLEEEGKRLFAAGAKAMTAGMDLPGRFFEAAGASPSAAGFSAAAASCLMFSSLISIPLAAYFFAGAAARIAALAALRLPLRVFAFVFVRWPRHGRPRLWRRPR